MKPTYHAAVTFESETQPPKTARMQVEGTPGTALRRALSAQKRVFPNSKWSSVVIVLTKQS